MPGAHRSPPNGQVETFLSLEMMGSRNDDLGESAFDRLALSHDRGTLAKTGFTICGRQQVEDAMFMRSRNIGLVVKTVGPWTPAWVQNGGLHRDA